MKTALPTLAAVLLTCLSGAAKEPAPRVSNNSAVAACSHCAKSPCHCGFSPSYYTQYRKPIRRVTTAFAPVTPHWTRPRPEAVVPTPRPPRNVPSLQPSQSLGYAPALIGPPHRNAGVEYQESYGRDPNREARDPRGHGRDHHHSRPISQHRFTPQYHFTPRAPLPVLTPTPRRPAAVPTRVVKQKTGFDPSRARSWSRGATSFGRSYRPTTRR
jgi:hypothetical protein